MFVLRHISKTRFSKSQNFQYTLPVDLLLGLQYLFTSGIVDNVIFLIISHMMHCVYSYQQEVSITVYHGWIHQWLKCGVTAQ